MRLPVVGAPVLPQMVGRYERGLYRLAEGPLYVTTGIGTWGVPARFLCRPELAVLSGKVAHP